MKKPMSSRAFEEMLNKNNKNQEEPTTEDFQRNSLANLAKDKMDLLLSNKLSHT